MDLRGDESPSWLGRKSDEAAMKIPVGFGSIFQSSRARNGPATHTEGDDFEIYSLQSDRSPEERSLRRM